MTIMQAPIPVRPELRRWVRGAEAAEIDNEGTHIHLPEPGNSLVWTWTRQDQTRVINIAPRPEADYFTGKRELRLVRIDLRPGLQRLLRLDQLPVIPLPTSPLNVGETLQRSSSSLQNALADRLDRAKSRELSQASLVVEAAALLDSGARRRTVAEVATRLAISERQLRRIFTAHTGMSPKRYAALVRVRRVLADSAGSWADRALRAGYYDQSHMVAEFTRHMHVTPQAFVERRLPAPDAC